MEVNVSFALVISEEVAELINSDELDVLDIVSRLNCNISHDLVESVYQHNDFEVVN